MKKLKQAALTKLVKENNLEITRGKIPSKPRACMHKHKRTGVRDAISYYGNEG